MHYVAKEAFRCACFENYRRFVTLSLLRFGSFLLFDVLKDLTKQSSKLHVCLMCFVSDQEFRLVLGPW